MSKPNIRSRAYILVANAIKNGSLADLKKQYIKCSDCDNRATVYDHRDYTKPLMVDPVCKSCNWHRGADITKTRELIVQVRMSKEFKELIFDAARKEPRGASELVRRAIAKELGLWSPDKGMTL